MSLPCNRLLLRTPVLTYFYQESYFHLKIHSRLHLRRHRSQNRILSQNHPPSRQSPQVIVNHSLGFGATLDVAL